MNAFLRLALLVCAAFPMLAPAASTSYLAGQVSRVVKGDTIVLTSQGAQYEVRLAGIDAPDRDQPWGEASAQELERILVGRAVVVDWARRDRWQRVVGVVRLAGEDINLRQLGLGLARCLERGPEGQPPGVRQAYAAAERAAKNARRGLWSEPGYVRHGNLPGQPFR